jgi:hypothetical protein
MGDRNISILIAHVAAREHDEQIFVCIPVRFAQPHGYRCLTSVQAKFVPNQVVVVLDCEAGLHCGLQSNDVSPSFTSVLHNLLEALSKSR